VYSLTEGGGTAPEEGRLHVHGTCLCVQEREKSVSDVAVPAAAAVVSNIPRVTAHVTDTVTGRPASGVALKLFTENQSGTWSHVADRYMTVLMEKHTPMNAKSELLRLAASLPAAV